MFGNPVLQSSRANYYTFLTCELYDEWYGVNNLVPRLSLVPIPYAEVKLSFCLFGFVGKTLPGVAALTNA